MKKFIIILVIFSGLAFAFEGALVKSLLPIFSKTTLETVSKQYGKNGLKALEKLSVQHGSQSKMMLDKMYARYGTQGVGMLAKYGLQMTNPVVYKIVMTFGEKAFYMVLQHPKSIAFFEKYGKRFYNIADKFGTQRVMQYMEQSAKVNKDGKVLRFMEKFGANGVKLLEQHWGKLVASSFVLLNADSLIESTKNLGGTAMHEVSNVAVKGIGAVANSQIGYFMGIALLLLVVFKYGIDFLDAILRRIKKRKQWDGQSISSKE